MENLENCRYGNVNLTNEFLTQWKNCCEKVKTKERIFKFLSLKHRKTRKL